MSKRKTDFRSIKALRDRAMARSELRLQGSPRAPAAGATSFSIKTEDPEIARLVAAFLARKGQKPDMPANPKASDSGLAKGQDSA